MGQPCSEHMSLRPWGSPFWGAALDSSLQLFPDELPKPHCVLAAAGEASAKEDSWGQRLPGVDGLHELPAAKHLGPNKTKTSCRGREV